MCACTEPVRSGIGSVRVEYGRPKWPITMLNHTNIPGTEKCFYFLFLAPYARTTRYEEAFFSLENQGKKARFALAPHYNPSENLPITPTYPVPKETDMLMSWVV